MFIRTKLSQILSVLVAVCLVLLLTLGAGWWLPGHELSTPESFHRLLLVVLSAIAALIAWVTDPLGRELPKNSSDPIKLHIFHSWGLWTIVASGEIRTTSYRASTSERVTGKYLDQQRQCTCCGLTQIKRVSIKVD